MCSLRTACSAPFPRALCAGLFLPVCVCCVLYMSCQAWYHWLHRKGFLLGSIKLTLFFFTFVISNALFMAANFGPESCFFSRTGAGFEPRAAHSFAALLLFLAWRLYASPFHPLHRVSQALTSGSYLVSCWPNTPSEYWLCQS